MNPRVCLIFTALIAGCAKAPENIAAQTVSTAAYEPFDCARLSQESGTVTARLDELTAKQTKERVDDAVGAVAFGVVGTMINDGGHEDEIGRLKGEKAAILKVQTSKGCV